MCDVFRKTVYSAVLAVSLFLIFQLQVSAQSPGSLSGRITDTERAAVTGASVTLFLRETTGRVTTLTDEHGAYRFERLAVGDYIVEVVSQGFGRISRALRVESGQNTALNLQLEIVGPSETVLITASGTPQTVDEVSKAITVIGSQEIEQRNEYGIAEAVRTVPGLRIQQLGGPGTFVRILTRGLRDFDTGVLMDGLRFRDVSSPQGDATGFIEELYTVSPDRLEVLRGSGSSLYGTNSIGGVVNILSDQGGGPFHGEVQLEGGSLGLFRGRTKLAGGLDSNRFVYSGGAALLNVTNGVNDTPTRSISGQGFARYNFTPDISLSGRFYGNSAYLALTDSPFAPPPGVVLPPAASIVNAVAFSLEQQRRFEAGLPVTSVGNANYIS
ncbi:MAG: TonB-dependent receptor plug domain-containing protein, partial [Pyrinomonadaceae bacterium]